MQSQCPTWSDLTALAFHFATQCLPTPLAWHAHHMPLLLLKVRLARSYARSYPRPHPRSYTLSYPRRHPRSYPRSYPRCGSLLPLVEGKCRRHLRHRATGGHPTPSPLTPGAPPAMHRLPCIACHASSCCISARVLPGVAPPSVSAFFAPQSVVSLSLLPPPVCSHSPFTGEGSRRGAAAHPPASHRSHRSVTFHSIQRDLTRPHFIPFVLTSHPT